MKEIRVCEIRADAAAAGAAKVLKLEGIPMILAFIASCRTIKI